MANGRTLMESLIFCLFVLCFFFWFLQSISFTIFMQINICLLPTWLRSELSNKCFSRVNAGQTFITNPLKYLKMDFSYYKFIIKLIITRIGSNSTIGLASFRLRSYEIHIQNNTQKFSDA